MSKAHKQQYNKMFNKKSLFVLTVFILSFLGSIGESYSQVSMRSLQRVNFDSLRTTVGRIDTLESPTDTIYVNDVLKILGGSVFGTTSQTDTLFSSGDTVFINDNLKIVNGLIIDTLYAHANDTIYVGDNIKLLSTLNVSGVARFDTNVFINGINVIDSVKALIEDSLSAGTSDSSRASNVADTVLNNILIGQLTGGADSLATKMNLSDNQIKSGTVTFQSQITMDDTLDVDVIELAPSVHINNNDYDNLVDGGETSLHTHPGGANTVLFDSLKTLTFTVENPDDGDLIPVLGDINNLSSGGSLSSGTDIELDTNAGTGKIRIEIASGSDLDGSIEFHGALVNRDLGTATDTVHSINITSSDSTYITPFWFTTNSNDSLYLRTANVNVVLNADQMAFWQNDRPSGSTDYKIARLGITVKSQDVAPAKNIDINFLKIDADADTTGLFDVGAELNDQTLNRKAVYRWDRDIASGNQFIDANNNEGIILTFTPNNVESATFIIYYLDTENTGFQADNTVKLGGDSSKFWLKKSELSDTLIARNFIGEAFQSLTTVTTDTAYNIDGSTLTSGVGLKFRHANTSTGIEIQNDGTGEGLLITNNSTGKGIFINQDGEQVALEIDHEGTTANAVEINSEATSGEVVHITANALTNGHGLQVSTSASQTSAFRLVEFIGTHSSNAGDILKITQNGGSATGKGINLLNEGTGNGLFIDQDGNGIAFRIDSETSSQSSIGIQTTGTSGDGINISGDSWTSAQGIEIVSSGASFTGDVFKGQISDSESSGKGLHILNVGNGNSIFIDQDGNLGSAITIDSEADSADTFDINADGLKVGYVFDISADGLETNGGIIQAVSTSASISGGNLMLVQASSASSATTIANFQNFGNGTTLQLGNNGSSRTFLLDNTGTGKTMEAKNGGTMIFELETDSSTIVHFDFDHRGQTLPNTDIDFTSFSTNSNFLRPAGDKNDTTEVFAEFDSIGTLSGLFPIMTAQDPDTSSELQTLYMFSKVIEVPFQMAGVDSVVFEYLTSQNDSTVSTIKVDVYEWSDGVATWQDSTITLASDSVWQHEATLSTFANITKYSKFIVITKLRTMFSEAFVRIGRMKVYWKEGS